MRDFFPMTFIDESQNPIAEKSGDLFRRVTEIQCMADLIRMHFHRIQNQIIERKCQVRIGVRVGMAEK